MDLKQLEIFKAVADELSFSRAAAKLGRVQSSVSAQVAALEADLGVPLFDRLGRRIALTEAGAVMLEYSQRLLTLATEAASAVGDAGASTGEVTGSLTVSAPETLLTYRLPALLARFHRKYPNVRFSVRPTAIGRLIGGTRRAIQEGEVDVAFVLDGPVAVQHLQVEPLIREGVTVIAPSAHALVPHASVSPADLSGETLLLPEAPESGCAYRGQLEHQLAAAGVAPPKKIEFQSIEAVKQCVVAGMGISVLPTVSVDADLANSKLARLAWREPFEVLTQMVWHDGRWQSPALKAFLETSREVFAPASGTHPL